MKITKPKKVLTVAALLFSMLLLYGRKKYQAAVQVLENVQVGLKTVRQVKFSGNNIVLKAILTLKNQTHIDFGATLGSKIIIKQIRVYTDAGVYLGKADTYIYKIDLPSQKTVTLPEAQFTIPLNKALNTLFSGFDYNKLKYKIDVEAFGSIITL